MRERVLYARCVYGKAETDAVLSILDGGPTSLRPGRSVAEMERRVAEISGHSLGLMCNSGSSALFLAIELAGLCPGDEVVTSALTFSTDVSAIVKAGLIPVFVDVEPDTYNVDAGAIEGALSERTRALLLPNLIGNTPDWDAIAEIAKRRDLVLIEDSCDALGATLHGAPTGSRADMSVTSFAMAHVITCAGNGGMVMLNEGTQRDRGLMLRRWGRRSEPNLFGTSGTGRVFAEDLDGIPYDNDFIFDEMSWNFEPSELGAAFGLAELDRLEEFSDRRRRNFARYNDARLPLVDRLVLPRQRDGLVTAWLCYPLQLRPGLSRSALQAFLDAENIETRTVWTGNVTRQPMMRGVQHRVGPGGLSNTDQVMESGILLPCHHGLSDDDVDYVAGRVAAAFVGGG